MKILDKLIIWLIRTSGIEPNCTIEMLKKNKKDVVNISPSVSSWADEGYLFDFKNFATQYNNGVVVNSINPLDSNVVDPQGGSFVIADDNTKFVRLKPVDVLHELEMQPTPFSLVLLDEKIAMLKDKASLIRQDYSKREVEALIERLENRKKYNEFRPFFESFNSTTEEKISALLKKHTNLCMKTSDIFIPEFPDIAIKRMKEYEDNLQKLCGKKPVFYVIAEHEKFQEAYKQRDPILLAQSPFGFFYSILGAWDKEMMLLSEL